MTTDWASADCPNPSARQNKNDTGSDPHSFDERAEKRVTGCLPRKLFLLVDRNSIDEANDLFVTGRFRPGIKLNEYFDSDLERKNVNVTSHLQ